MIDNNVIKNAIRTLANTDEAIYSVRCTVTDIDTDSNTCSCTPIDGVSADLLDVKLIANNGNGFILFPTINSTVIVCMLNKTSGYISMADVLDSIQLNGSNFDGLVKVAALTTKLQAIENLLNQFITIYNAHTHAVSGAATLIPNTLETNTLTPTQQSDLENTTVKHGDGT